MTYEGNAFESRVRRSRWTTYALLPVPGRSVMRLRDVPDTRWPDRIEPVARSPVGWVSEA